MSFDQPPDEQLADAVASLTVESHKDAIDTVAGTQAALVQLRRQRVAAFDKRWDAGLIPNRKANAEAALESLAKSVSEFVGLVASECHLGEVATVWLKERVAAAVGSAVAAEVGKRLSTSD